MKFSYFCKEVAKFFYMEYYLDPVCFIQEKTGGDNKAIRNLLELLDDGATIPFIARYRKEKTGNMDEVRLGR